jgi:Protein of unknown function (DUF559)
MVSAFHAQYRPVDDIPIQPDFYYERDGIPGVCVFADGPHHHRRKQAEYDRQSRKALEDQGYRVVRIDGERSISEQVGEHADIFTRLVEWPEPDRCCFDLTARLSRAQLSRSSREGPP